ncbi:MAG: hypothetical protein LBN07_03660 [Christensenellaceae bacterium]|jgi:Ca2+/Na+ antiporter|nr:hypothetical protein [Christensenellaceae bacterium]
MKENIKKFFKSKFNISVLVLVVLGIIFACLGVLGPIFLILGVLFFIVASAMLCFAFHKRYEANKDYEPENEGVFDATKIDFDEDVYSIPYKKKLIKKRKLSKLDAMGPVVLFGILAALFAVYLVVLIAGLFV